MATIEALDTDVTTLEVDAIANAANTELRHGGGVAGAIARAGGPAIDEESRRAAPIGLGEAVDRLVELCRGGPGHADVERLEVADEEPEGLAGFEIR